MQGIQINRSWEYILRIVACYFVIILESQGEVYIRHGPKHQRVRAGQIVTFHCSAGSDSLLSGLPTVEWRRDDERIKFTKDRRFKKDQLDNTLTIFNASIPDTGLYTCVARLGDETDSASAQLIVEDVPDPPVDVELMQCDGRFAQLQWKLISENYSPVIQFIIQYNTSFAPNVWRNAKNMLPRDRYYQRIALSPWGNYSFRVIAQNAVGNSPSSKATNKMCHTPPDVPHHNPKGVCTKNTKPHTLVIMWELMPLEEHNAPGFYYLVKWRRHDLASAEAYQEKTVNADQNLLTIENQPIYKPYEIYVLAINEVGEAVSPPRMFIGYSGEDVPLEIPLNFRLDEEKETTESTADFIWDAVNTGPWRMQGFFRGYKIQFWQTQLGEITMREHNIIYREPGPCWRNHRQKRELVAGHVYNLWPYTNITARILALNARYEGSPSKSITFMTKEGVPGPVSQFRVLRRGSNHLELSWQKPSLLNGLLSGYTLSYQAMGIHDGQYGYKEEIEIDDPDMVLLRVRGLIPETTYRLSICAQTKAGGGQPVDLEDTTLPEGPPVAPNFTTVNISKRAINVTWFPSTTGNPGTVFTVQYRRLGQLYWILSAEETSKSWTIIEGLVPGVIYEMRVVARNGDSKDSPETSSPVQRVRIGMKRGSGYWRTSDDVPRDQLATVKDLEPGTSYEVRAVAKSDLGESPSLIQEVVAGMDPDAQASRATESNGSAGLLSDLSIVALTLLVTHLAVHLSHMFHQFHEVCL